MSRGHARCSRSAMMTSPMRSVQGRLQERKGQVADLLNWNFRRFKRSNDLPFIDFRFEKMLHLKVKCLKIN